MRCEALAGDAWQQGGRLPEAAEALRGDLRRLSVAGDRLRESGLLLKRSWLEEKLSKCREAQRWAARALKISQRDCRA